MHAWDMTHLCARHPPRKMMTSKIRSYTCMYNSFLCAIYLMCMMRDIIQVLRKFEVFMTVAQFDDMMGSCLKLPKTSHVDYMLFLEKFLTFSGNPSAQTSRTENSKGVFASNDDALGATQMHTGGGKNLNMLQARAERARESLERVSKTSIGSPMVIHEYMFVYVFSKRTLYATHTAILSHTHTLSDSRSLPHTLSHTHTHTYIHTHTFITHRYMVKGNVEHPQPPFVMNV